MNWLKRCFEKLRRIYYFGECPEERAEQERRMREYEEWLWEPMNRRLHYVDEGTIRGSKAVRVVSMFHDYPAGDWATRDGRVVHGPHDSTWRSDWWAVLPEWWP